MRLTSIYTRVAMPPNKPCPHCGRPVGDWHREWYIKEHRDSQYQQISAADCPYDDCHGGVNLYDKEDKVPPVDPTLPKNKRSWQQAVKWAGSELKLQNYLQTSTAGRQYANYHFDP